MKIGSVALASPFAVAPMAGMTDSAFRRLVKRHGGCGLVVTEMVSSEGLVRGIDRTLEYAEYTEEERPVSIQIFGGDPAKMAEAARVVEGLGADVVDVNMGCPVPKIAKHSAGCSLMRDPVHAQRVVSAMVQAVKIPVTVKMRLGWDASTHTAPELAREFELSGVKGITIHGRTREQGFSGNVDLDGIRRVVEATRDIPVLGNGDVKTLADAARMLRETGCAGLAIGRGAFLNPWFFRQLDAWDRTGDPGPGPSPLERLRFMRRHFRLLSTIRDERFACLTFRKVAGWYCKALKPGHDLQQELVMLRSIDHFESLANRVEERIAHRAADAWEPIDHAVAVPDGPISHW